MGQLIHGYVVERLRHADLTTVAADTRINRSTLYRIATGRMSNPGIKYVEALYFYFRDREGSDLRQKFSARRQGKRA
jgi:hypothetical protein